MKKTIRKVTRRFVLQAGFSCNARCRFCYYKESLRKRIVRDFTTKEVKEKLREGRRLGKTMVDISGGEPTIRKDIFEIIEYAKKIGYKTICLITNGIRTANEDFCDKLIRSGMNDILLSVHSPVEKDHDWLTRVPGSYKKIISTLKYISTKKQVTLRINSTISNFNYKTIHLLFELVKPYKPNAVNILVLNPSQETLIGTEDKIVIEDYEKTCEKIKKEIEKYQKYLNIINVRFIPFCMLKGHEEKIRTMWQKMYEDEEWCPYMNIKYNRGLSKVMLSFIGGLILYPIKTPKYGKRDLFTLFNEILTTFRGFYHYKHSNKCKECSLIKICPGFAKNYVKRFNKTRVYPYKLKKKIKDPLYFCRDYDENFESLRLSKK